MYIVIFILLNSFLLSFINNEFSSLTYNYISFSYCSLMFLLNLIYLMFVDISLLVLSDLYGIFLLFDEITLLIMDNIMLYYCCHSILLFDIFGVLMDIALLVLFLLRNISLNFHWFSTLIFDYLVIYLSNFLSIFHEFNLLFLQSIFSTFLFVDICLNFKQIAFGISYLGCFNGSLDMLIILNHISLYFNCVACFLILFNIDFIMLYFHNMTF